jgi:propanol-preferring alcohol dehydrogenase
LALQIGAQGMGFRMIGIDMGDKETISRECGAEAFFDPSKYAKGELAAEIKETTGGMGATAVIVCTSNNTAYAQGMDLLKIGGTMVCVGIPEGEEVVLPNATPTNFIFKQCQVLGSSVGNRLEAIQLMQMAASGKVKTHFQTKRLEDAPEIFETMDRGALQGRVVIDLQA